MPSYYEVDTELGVVYSVVSGDVTLQDLRDNMVAIHNDPRVEAHFRTLIDGSRITSMDADFEGLTELSDFHAGSVRKLTGRLAIYIPERGVVYGQTRQFHALLRDRDRVEIFTGLDEARAWLGIA